MISKYKKRNSRLLVQHASRGWLRFLADVKLADAIRKTLRHINP